MLMVLLQTPGLADCSLIGVCGVKEQVGPPSGLMYLAIGLVVGGVWGLWRERKKPAGKTTG